MRKLYITKWINRTEMKFHLVLDYTLPSTWQKFTQADIQNDGGSLSLVMSLKTHSCLSHLIKRQSLMFSLRQYCLDFPIFKMIDSKFHFSPTFTSNLFFWTRNTNDIIELNGFGKTHRERKFVVELKFNNKLKEGWRARKMRKSCSRRFSYVKTLK